jgi:hypothetical protein
LGLAITLLAAWGWSSRCRRSGVGRWRCGPPSARTGAADRPDVRRAGCGRGADDGLNSPQTRRITAELLTTESWFRMLPVLATIASGVVVTVADAILGGTSTWALEPPVATQEAQQHHTLKAVDARGQGRRLATARKNDLRASHEDFDLVQDPAREPSAGPLPPGFWGVPPCPSGL